MFTGTIGSTNQGGFVAYSSEVDQFLMENARGIHEFVIAEGNKCRGNHWDQGEIAEKLMERFPQMEAPGFKNTREDIVASIWRVASRP